MNEPFAEFFVGDRVEKFTGDYQLVGEVRASFTTKGGKVRYVVEHDPGFLHIYNGTQLRLVTDAATQVVGEFMDALTAFNEGQANNASPEPA